ncbi:hypothetical protein [Plantactinospora sp. GCM10030261]|uniref:hypothetical protein n=1 Tax=Plantactinospora sp. GCM10030261 TaxID=3273420 RepID=UPI00362077B0
MAAAPAEPADADVTQVQPAGAGRGTVYGGYGLSEVGQRTVPVFPSSAETSGSLTGHILAQGWADAPSSGGGTAKVVIALAIALGLLVLVGLAVALIAGDAINSLFTGVFGS